MVQGRNQSFKPSQTLSMHGRHGKEKGAKSMCEVVSQEMPFVTSAFILLARTQSHGTDSYVEFWKAWNWKSEVLLFWKKGRKVLVGSLQSLPQWTKLAVFL